MSGTSAGVRLPSGLAAFCVSRVGSVGWHAGDSRWDRELAPLSVLRAQPFGRYFQPAAGTFASEFIIHCSAQLIRDEVTDYGCAISPGIGGSYRWAADLQPIEHQPATQPPLDALRQRTKTWPHPLDRAPYLAALVASSCRTIANDCAASAASMMSGPSIRLLRSPMHGASSLRTSSPRRTPSQWLRLSRAWVFAKELMRPLRTSRNSYGSCDDVVGISAHARRLPCEVELRVALGQSPRCLLPLSDVDLHAHDADDFAALIG